jgi:cullin-associated NEDD8-dissociated protein 1
VAVSDIKNQLEHLGDDELDAKLQSDLRNAITKLIADKNSDVATVSVNCLAVLVPRFSREENLAMVTHLLKLIVGTNATNDARGTWADALTTIIEAAREEDGQVIADDAVKPLMCGLRGEVKGEDPDDITPNLLCLDLMRRLCAKFGEQMEPHFSEIVNQLLELLEHDHVDVRKRTNETFGTLFGILDEQNFKLALEHIISKIESADKTSKTIFSYIQTLRIISSVAGVRVGPHLSRVIPRLLELCELDKDEQEEATEDRVELWENCLQALESLVDRCRWAVTDYVKDIVTRSIQFASYDPNVADPVAESGADSTMSDDGDCDDDDDGWGDDDDDNDDDGWGDDSGDADNGGDWGTSAGAAAAAVSSDSDMSWKVRRAAVDVLDAFISARGDILRDYFEELIDTLIARFAERDRNVQIKVFACCQNLLRHAVVSTHEMDEHKQAQGLSVPVIVRQRSSFESLDGRIEHIIAAGGSQFEKGDAVTRKAVISVFRELLIVRHQAGNVSEYLPQIFPQVLAAVSQDDHVLQTDALDLLHLILEFHDSSAVSDFVTSIIDAVKPTVADTSSNVVVCAGGLRVLGSLASKLSGNGNSFVESVYPTVHERLVANGEDESIRKAAVFAGSKLAAAFGSSAKEQSDEILTVFVDRMHNQVTRLDILHGIHRIAESDCDAPLDAVLTSEPLHEIVSYLRQARTDFRHQAADTLLALVRHAHDTIALDDLSHMLREFLSHMQAATDTQMLQRVFDIITELAKSRPDTESEFINIMDEAFALVTNPLVQGTAAESLQNMFAAAVEANTTDKSLEFGTIVDKLTGLVQADTAPPVVESVASALSRVLIAGGADAHSIIADLISESSGESKEAHRQTLALRTLGELGLRKDMSDNSGIESSVLSAFSSPHRSVRHAASFSLGAIVSGNVDKFLSFLLKNIRSGSDELYLLLSSLKDVIANHSGDIEATEQIYPHIGDILSLLMKNAESKEQLVRDSAAQCLGRLSGVDAGSVVPRLAELAKSDRGEVRALSMVALRAAVVHDCVDSSHFQQTGFHQFLALLKDSDIEARRQAVLTVDAMLRDRYYDLLRSEIENTILPAMYDQVKQDTSLVDEINYGTHIEKIDHGLPLRRAVFSTLHSILRSFGFRVNLNLLIKNVSQGLAQESEEIQLAAYTFLGDCAAHHPGSLLEEIGSTPSLITKGIMPKIKLANKMDAKEVTVERQKVIGAYELLKQEMRVFRRIAKVPGIDRVEKYWSFYKRVLATKILKRIIGELEAEEATA